MDTQQLAQDNLIFKCLAGSHSYGMNTEDSDVDYRGIFVAPPVSILTPFFPIEQVQDNKEQDTVYYGLWHFMKLVLDCNPNIIELLHTDESNIVYHNDCYDLLREHRNKLLCSKVAFTFSGYAIAQLKRIKGHKKWIMNPMPEQPPLPCEYVSLVQWFGKNKIMPRDFNIMAFKFDYRLIPYSETLFGLYPAEGHQTVNDDGSLNTVFEDSRENYHVPLAFIKWNRDEYKTTKEKHELYWNWKRNRNEKRAALEEKMGFDGKHASHLVRLVRMCREILETGQVIVKRPDAQELLSIRNGAWTYDQLIEYAEQMDNEIQNVWYKKTQLPKKPDFKFAAELLMQVQKLAWSKHV